MWSQAEGEIEEKMEKGMALLGDQRLGIHTLAHYSFLAFHTFVHEAFLAFHTLAQTGCVGSKKKIWK